MKNRMLLVLLFLTGFGLFAESINLEQARVLALTSSRSLAKYNLSLRSSLLDQRSQLYSMLPNLSAEYSATMNYLDRDWGFVNPVDTLNAGATFSVTQKIFEGGKSFIQKALSGIATESVRNEALSEYYSVLDSVDNAYYAALEAAASLAAAESSLDKANSSLMIAEIRQANGIINRGDYLRALADKEAQENSRNQARRSLSLTMARLNVLIGLPQTPELEQVDFSAYEGIIQRLAGISDNDANALFGRFWEILLRSNPSLIRANLNNQRAEKNLSLARRDYSPTISATLFSTGLNYSIANGFTNSSGGGLSIRGSIPIDFWVMANRLEKSKISRDSAAIDYINAEISLDIELQSALINLIAQAESVLSTRRTLEYTESHYEFAAERYRLSQASVADLAEASSLLINSRNNSIRASYGFLQSLSRLRSLSVIDDEERLINLLLNYTP